MSRARPMAARLTRSSLSRMKVATSANSVTQRHTFLSLFIIPFEFNASIKKNYPMYTNEKNIRNNARVFNSFGEQTS